MSKTDRARPETGLDMAIVEQPTLKTKLQGIIPLSILVYLRSMKNVIQLGRAFLFDCTYFSKYSSSSVTGDTKEKLSALITLSYHNLEKGMSLHKPRALFGRPNIKRLALRLERYVTTFGWDHTSTVALNVLKAYREFNIKTHNKEDPEVDRILEHLQFISSELPHSVLSGGIKSVQKEDIFKVSKLNMKNFFLSRSSIRSFSAQEVSRDDIVNAIEMAQKTPSVCNRQSSRVVAVTDPDKINRLLELQGGARGFKEQVPCLLIFSSSLASFQSAGERYQCWIDGGMFSMSVIYALHSLGLGSCALNWSKYPEQDIALVNMVPELSGERVIMFLAVGHLPDRLNVPQSTSPLLSDILRWYE